MKKNSNHNPQQGIKPVHRTEQRLDPSLPPASPESLFKLFMIFLRLGLTSFGGPVAHLAYFREEFVHKRAWLSEKSYGSLVALCQFLPGPASSQVGLSIGLMRKGYAGAFVAWLGFTLPSVLLLMLFALQITQVNNELPVGVLHGLKVAAAAVVAQAIWGMGSSFSRGTMKLAITLFSAALLTIFPLVYMQILVICVAGLIALVIFPQSDSIDDTSSLILTVSRKAGSCWFAMFALLLLALPVLAALFPAQWLTLVDAFYRSGALVFGGGHVVLPLLHAETVGTGWLADSTFVAGYGATQAVPGPLFTFSAFLGTAIENPPVTAIFTGLLCLIMIFIPSFLLVFAALPFWQHIRHNTKVQTALMGINAAVVGLLLAAFYDPVLTSAISSELDLALVLIALVALMKCRVAPWLVVIICAISGWLLA